MLHISPAGGHARFLGPRQVEFVGLASLEENNGEGQETLLGNKGSLDFWDEYPPTLEEYNRVCTGS
ncbi:MAG TPA: hypothetical protein VEZ71_09570 [Archangium sp.]|nr:hypothetical protein [Archangium sp.]